jgi:hypothetical protein
MSVFTKVIKKVTRTEGEPFVTKTDNTAVLQFITVVEMLFKLNLFLLLKKLAILDGKLESWLVDGSNQRSWVQILV